ncbi:MAG: OmpA family protein [Deltaproteobacteria bacterium]|nr:MAG: OmpA family protein [Deltaproteobacteria bacterium]
MKKFLIFTLFLQLLLSPKVFALNSDSFRIPFDQQRHILLSDSQVLPFRAWSTGFHLNFADQPLEVGTIDSLSRATPVVDNLFMMNLTAAIGLAEWVSVGLVLPFSPSLDLQPVGETLQSNHSSLGDVGVSGKFQIWSQEVHEAKMGFALIPAITFPTGSVEKFTGDSNVTGTLKAVYDVDVFKNQILANMGFRFREKENLLNLSVGQEFLFGLGYARPVWEAQDLHVMTEVVGSTTLNSGTGSANGTPLEWLSGVRKVFHSEKIPGTLCANLGGALGLTHGYGTPTYRVFAGLTYEGLPYGKRKDRKSREPEELARVEMGRIVTLQPIYFETNRSDIKEESLSVVQAVASILKNDRSIHHLVVEGHTDDRSSDKYNLTLSQKRADEVKRQLIVRGVDASRLSSRGYGESQPVASNDTEEGRAQNRRTEFRILEIQEIKKVKILKKSGSKNKPKMKRSH